MIRVQVEAKTVIEGYLTGSCIFWPNDAHDLDIINVCETINSYKEKIPFDKYTILSNPPRDLPLGLDLDVLNISPEELKERFNYRSTKFR